jgi:hypothetical protein
MMQSCASAAKLRGGGPILRRGSKTKSQVGVHEIGRALKRRPEVRSVRHQPSRELIDLALEFQILVSLRPIKEDTR